jgi:hypothetical protein
LGYHRGGCGAVLGLLEGKKLIQFFPDFFIAFSKKIYTFAALTD